MELRQGTIELADRRTVGYAEWGDPDSASRLIYCHGSPGCRLEIGALTHALAGSDLDVRVTAFDRPGYGRSSPRPGHTFMDWAEDAAAAADRLGIGTFSVLGASGGSPYAMACAIALCDRVSRLGIVVGTGPMAATGMERSALVRLLPRLGVVRTLQFSMAALAFRWGHGDRVVARSLGRFAEVDRTTMGQPEVRAWFESVFAESMRQGGRAAAAETEMYWSDWGFEPRDVPVPTWLWYGGRDSNVPADVGRWLHREMADSHLTIWPDHGHYTWAFSPAAVESVASLAAVAR